MTKGRTYKDDELCETRRVLRELRDKLRSLDHLYGIGGAKSQKLDAYKKAVQELNVILSV